MTSISALSSPLQKSRGQALSLSLTVLSAMMTSSRWRLEAYQDIATQELEKIARDATHQFNLLHVDIIHRIGRLTVGENILIIVVAAGHRPQAYPGSRLHSRRDQERCTDLEKGTDKRRWTVGTGQHSSG